MSAESINTSNSDCDKLNFFEDLLDVHLTNDRNIFSKPGFVYIMQSESNISKIGVTSDDPINRLNTLNRSYWYIIELKYLWFCYNPHIYERFLHKQFNDYRIKGEWFRLSSEEIVGRTTDERNKYPIIRWEKFDKRGRYNRILKEAFAVYKKEQDEFLSNERLSVSSES